jgi:hypothetical protein
VQYVAKGQNQTSRCELIHIPIDLSCASLLSYVRGRPVSWESRWRLTRQAPNFICLLSGTTRSQSAGCSLGLRDFGYILQQA